MPDPDDMTLFFAEDLAVITGGGEQVRFAEVAADGLVLFASPSCAACVADAPGMWRLMGRIPVAPRYLLLTSGREEADAFVATIDADPDQVLRPVAGADGAGMPQFVVEMVPTIVWFDDGEPMLMRVGRPGPLWPYQWWVRWRWHVLFNNAVVRPHPEGG
jgi:hypothetical protein